jgi:hypothetical protein
MAKNYLTSFAESVIVGFLFLSFYKTINTSSTILFISGVLFYFFFEITGLNTYLHSNTTQIQVIKEEDKSATLSVK